MNRSEYYHNIVTWIQSHDVQSEFGQFTDQLQINFTVSNPDMQNAFATVGTIMATLVAIIFSISLVMIQTGSDKYSYHILKLFTHNSTTRGLIGLSLTTILVSLFLMWQGTTNWHSFLIVFLLFVVWIIVFWYYYQYMIKITNYEQVVYIMTDSFTKNLKRGKEKQAEQILEAIEDTAIRGIHRLDIDFSFKFTKAFFDLYHSVLGEGKCSWAKKEIFNHFYNAASRAIEFRIPFRNYLWAEVLTIPNCEIAECSQVDFEFINNYISKTLFWLTKKVIDEDDVEAFKTEIRTYSQTHVLGNPRLIQDSIIQEIAQEQSQMLHLFQYDDAKFDPMLEQYQLLNFLVKEQSVIDHGAVQTAIAEYKKYKYTLEKDTEALKISGNVLRGTIEELTENSSRVVDLLNSLFVAYKMHLLFFVIGAYLIFRGQEGDTKVQMYIRELWDYTDSKNPRTINANEPPVLFDPSWLTNVLFYGGSGRQFFYKAGKIHLTFDTFRDPEGALQTYYLLCMTRYLSKTTVDTQIPNLEGREENYLKRYLNFCDTFIQESETLLRNCEALIEDAEDWNQLFENEAQEQFERTKRWIQRNKEYCIETTTDLVRQIDYDRGKCQELRKCIKQGYGEIKLTDIASIEIIDGSDRNKQHFQKFSVEFSGGYPKKSLISDEYSFSPISYSKHVFEEIGKRIARMEEIFIVKAILKSKDITKASDSEVDTIVDTINRKQAILKRQGYNPSTIILPNRLFRSFYIKGFIEDSDKFVCQDETRLKIVYIPNSDFKYIILLNQKYGVARYIRQESEDGRLRVSLKEMEDQLHLDVRGCSEMSYNISDPNAFFIIDLS